MVSLILPDHCCCSRIIIINVAPGLSCLIMRMHQSPHFKGAVVAVWVKYKLLTLETRVCIPFGSYHCTVQFLSVLEKN